MTIKCVNTLAIKNVKDITGAYQSSSMLCFNTI